jgi:hypothetical protein
MDRNIIAKKKKKGKEEKETKREGREERNWLISRLAATRG